MHKTCIFTKPVFTDVNTRYACGIYAREESRGRGGGDGEETRDRVGRGGGPRRIASRGAQRHLFILPRRTDGENSFVDARGARMRALARARDRAVYTLRWRVRAMRKAQILLVAVMNDNGRPLIPAKHGGMPGRPLPLADFSGGPETRFRRTRARARAITGPYPGNYGIAPRG